MIFRQLCISRTNTGPGTMMVGGGETCRLTSYQVLGHLALGKLLYPPQSPAGGLSLLHRSKLRLRDFAQPASYFTNEW